MINIPQRGLITLANPTSYLTNTNLSIGLKSLKLLDASTFNIGQQQSRPVTKFSIRKGKRKSVKAVLFRFKRLHWGGWIRTRCGRHKKMHKKKANRKRRLRQHVIVNSTQAWLLDKMVTKFWKRPKYYIEDLYEPYHTRTYPYARREAQPMQERVD